MDAAQMNPFEFRYNELRALVVPLIFVISIGVSFLSVWATQVFGFLRSWFAQCCCGFSYAAMQANKPYLAGLWWLVDLFVCHT
jgi:hypothetical protein